MQEFLNEAQYFFQQYVDLHPYLVPLGIIGVWRWGVWLFKEIIALFYRPKKLPYWAKVSIVTPVYNENPNVFEKALYSWKQNFPAEIIAVIDRSDRRCIAVFRNFQNKFANARLITTTLPGKRPALACGIQFSENEIVALVDSDTIWDQNTISLALPPFNNPEIAGVATRQNVLNPKTLAQKIFDIQLDLRYSDDFAFLGAAGDALICLSGRTAFYRRQVLLPLLDDLVNETFWGKQVISGDDKRLTYLVLSHGYKVAYQSNSQVFTPGMTNIFSFLKQRLRWARNSLRADLKALLDGWSFRHPALAFFQIDKIAQAFVVIISPIYFASFLILGQWVPALIILVWWFVSRTIKIFPHLKRRPQDIVILPIFILFSFANIFLKIYALFTLNTQGWITRWDKSRLPQLRFIQTVPAYLATIASIFFLYLGVSYYQHQVYFLPLAQKHQHITTVLADQLSQPNVPQLPTGLSTSDGGLLVTRYEVKVGDTLENIAGKFGTDTQDLLAANISRLSNWNKLEPGFILSIPGKDIHLSSVQNFNYQRIYQDPKRIIVNPTTNTVDIYGRGQIVNLSDIKSAVGDKNLRELSPGEWLLSSNIFLHSGVTLNLDKSEVKWLKMQSNQKGHLSILAYNAVLHSDGVKITSWDTEKLDFDRNIDDGRSYILVKDGSRMDLYNSELAYLGYPRPEGGTASTYGVSWRMSNGKQGYVLLTGEVINSNFHHNYFGAYTFGATGITWRGNEFHDNIRYGLDPHDDSNGFLVENNLAYNNGSHGIIFSKRCVNNIIRNNQSFDNKLHGIMLHQDSNNNIIEDNLIYNNKDGVAMWNSKNNLVRNNKVYDNNRGIRANATSNNNLIENNLISGAKQYGIYLYGDAESNMIKNNTITNNPNALYIKSANNLVENNTIKLNEIGIYLTGTAEGNSISSNQINFNSKYGIYAKIPQTQRNYLQDNNMFRNRKDIFAS